MVQLSNIHLQTHQRHLLQTVQQKWLEARQRSTYPSKWKSDVSQARNGVHPRDKPVWESLGPPTHDLRESRDLVGSGEASLLLRRPRKESAATLTSLVQRHGMAAVAGAPASLAAPRHGGSAGSQSGRLVQDRTRWLSNRKKSPQISAPSSMH